ncbi:hypothetical protein [Micromonospora ureilytica]|uniref:hypothetical protein n=1 Tax=Micromonospora ureilytica TaxID=709868 RepID=UPI0040394EAA
MAAPLVLGLSLGDRRLRVVSLLVGGFALAYGVTQGPLTALTTLSLPYEGLAERVVLALLLVVVVLIARVLLLATTSATADPRSLALAHCPLPQYHHV